jgi:hypothetical protein
MTHDLNQQQAKTQVALLISGYDRFNGALVAALTLVFALVLFLLAYWLSNFEIRPGHNPEPWGLVALPESEQAPELGELVEPGVAEFPEVETPELVQALLVVTTAATNVRAQQAEFSGYDLRTGPGVQPWKRTGPPAIDKSEPQRWKIQFSAKSQDEYARQLSFFKIDLGAVHRQTNDIVRLSDPGGVPQVAKSSRKQEQSTLYFAHERPEFSRWEEQILKKNGVAVTDCLTVQFYPDEIREHLLKLEQEFLAKSGKTQQDVHQTIFKVVSNEGAYEFRVDQVTYRRR